VILTVTLCADRIAEWRFGNFDDYFPKGRVRGGRVTHRVVQTCYYRHYYYYRCRMSFV
jgi:hypothetical protein